MKIPKTSAYDILETLVHLEMLEKSFNEENVYKIGLKSYQIGNSYSKDKEIFNIIKRLNEEQNITMLLVEQNAHLALSIAVHGYVMENGKIVLDDTVAKLKENEDIKMFYLGLTEMGTKRSYRDAKFYKRRKRWLT